MRTPSPRNKAQQLICEYMEAVGLKRETFAREYCRRSLSWLDKILSGELRLSASAAMIIQVATEGALPGQALLKLADEPVEK